MFFVLSFRHGLYLLAVEQNLPAVMSSMGERYYRKADLDMTAEWYKKALVAGYEPGVEEYGHIIEVMG